MHDNDLNLNQNQNGINIDIDMNNYNLNYNKNNNIINNNKNNIFDSEAQIKFNTDYKINQKNINYFQNNNINNNYNYDNYEDYIKREKEEKYKELIKSQKNKRFTLIYKNKIKENNNTNNNSNNKEEVFIDDYIKLIKELYQDKINYFNYIAQRGFYNFSTCPFCGEPAFYIIERVSCINKCFITSVADDVFDQNYTLDNFMEQYKEYYSKHLNCKDDLMTLYVDKDSKCAEFLCYKCEKNFIDFN